MKLKVLFCTITLAVLGASESFAACYINTDSTSQCATGQSRWSIGWTPNISARDALQKSAAVQQSLNGCELMAKVIKAECQPAAPVISLYLADSGSYEVETAAIEIKAALSNDISLPNEFREYFRQTTLPPLAAPATPEPVGAPTMTVPKAPTRARALAVKAVDTVDSIVDTIVKMITPTPPTTCTFGGRTFSVGQGVMAFQSARATVCRSVMRTCQSDGTLSPSDYIAPACQANLKRNKFGNDFEL
jgi:hypothetical protein